MNMVHPPPPGGDMPYTSTPEATAQFEEYLDTAEQLGLYVQYDMRNTYLNLSSVQYQVCLHDPDPPPGGTLISADRVDP